MAALGAGFVSVAPEGMLRSVCPRCGPSPAAVPVAPAPIAAAPARDSGDAGTGLPAAPAASAESDSASADSTVAATPVAPPASPPPAAPAAPALPPYSGRLLIPVQGVRPDQLVDTYTAARSQGRSHDAIDIMAPGGTPVLAAAPGSVLKLFRSVRGGITLYELAPDQRTIYYYAHLQRYAAGVLEGRALRQGDLIGYVGDSGNAGAGNYHLHFEISTTSDPRRYWAGTPLNPYPLLRSGISLP